MQFEILLEEQMYTKKTSKINASNIQEPFK